MAYKPARQVAAAGRFVVLADAVDSRVPRAAAGFADNSLVHQAVVDSTAVLVAVAAGAAHNTVGLVAAPVAVHSIAVAVAVAVDVAVVGSDQTSSGPCYAYLAGRPCSQTRGMAPHMLS